MSRDIDSDDRDHGPEASARSIPSSGTGAASDSRALPLDPRASLDRALSKNPDSYRVLIWRDRVITVSPSEQGTLRTLGAFRTVAAPDLIRHRYDGNAQRFERDVRRLTRRGWVETHTLPGRHSGRGQTVMTLTREGHDFVTRYDARHEQHVHFGIVRPKEQAHDAALYRVAVNEAERLARQGATVTRVVLDAELKGELAAARNRPGTDDPAQRTQEAAQALHLRVVDGHVQVPDLRLEYETRDGSIARVDLELATEHYKPGQLAAKAQAGFTIYAPSSQTARMSAALEDRGLIATILSI